MNSDAKGRLAEWIAALFLTVKGYRILTLRYKTKVGEIDLITKRGKTLVFVEVKKRKTRDDALCAISPASQKRIHRAAEHFLSHHTKLASSLQTQDLDLRFDVIAIANYHTIHHLENAF